MADRLSVLTHKTQFMAKIWRADGTISPYDKGKNFTHKTRVVSNIEELSKFLSVMEGDPHSCIIRGELVASPPADHQDPVPVGKVRRRNDWFTDQALHTILIEVDDFYPIAADPIEDAEDAAREYINMKLPECFKGASFHWQLSNSAGHKNNKDKLKIHLWFWLKDKCTTEALARWHKSEKVECDGSVFRLVQVHYTAAPILEKGVTDPVPVRSGFYRGRNSDVDLGIEGEVFVEKKVKQRGVNHELDDYVVDYLTPLGDGDDGRIYIECPFKAGHSIDSGHTETVYFPKGTGGYDQGHFHCFHDSCSEFTDHDFLDAIGALTHDMEVVEVGANEPPPRPKFQLGGSSSNPFILNTYGNTVAAIEGRPDICGYDIKFDLFQRETMVKPERMAWRELKDSDYIRTAIRLENIGFKNIGKEKIRDAFHCVADTKTFDSMVDWVNKLPEWDGVPRIDTFYVDYFSAVDSPYVQAVGAYTWTALVGRSLVPGIKCDMVPILIGRQGTRKSSALANMVKSPENFGEISFDDKDAENARFMKAKSLMEIAEMRGLQTARNDAIKAFVTKQTDEYRPLYKEQTVKAGRRCIFIGTSNEWEILGDPTGHRRWLPFVTGKVYPVDIFRIREQLWAEALLRYRKHGIEWQEAQRLAGPAHEAHSIEDAIVAKILNWLNTKDEMTKKYPMEKGYITRNEVIEDCLGVKIGQGNNKDLTSRVSKALLGEKINLKGKNLGKPGWGYVRNGLA